MVYSIDLSRFLDTHCVCTPGTCFGSSPRLQQRPDDCLFTYSPNRCLASARQPPLAYTSKSLYEPPLFHPLVACGPPPLCSVSFSGCPRTQPKADHAKALTLPHVGLPSGPSKIVHSLQVFVRSRFCTRAGVPPSPFDNQPLPIARTSEIRCPNHEPLG